MIDVDMLAGQDVCSQVNKYNEIEDACIVLLDWVLRAMKVFVRRT
jgi:hypothetical protein